MGFSSGEQGLEASVFRLQKQRWSFGRKDTRGGGVVRFGWDKLAFGTSSSGTSGGLGSTLYPKLLTDLF